MKAKVLPTQERLGKLYDLTDTAVDFADCLFLATSTDEVRRHATGVCAVVEHLSDQLKTIRTQLHDLVEWA